MLKKRIRKIRSLIYAAVLTGTVTVGAINGAYSSEVKARGVEQLRNVMQERGYRQAIDLINDLRPDVQQRLDVRFYRATALAGVGKNSAAITAFKGLIQQEPLYPEFYNNLAMLQVKADKLLEAQQTLEQGLRSQQSYAALYNNLTVVFETMARRSYAKALRIKNEQPPALAVLVTLEGYSAPVQPEPVTVVAAVEREISPSPERRQPAKKPAVKVRKLEKEPSAIAPETKIEVNVAEAVSPLVRQIEARLHYWVDSWQSKDVAGYINSYASNFKSRGYSTHKAWLKGRRARVGNRAKIDILIEEITIESISSNRVQADFIMDYRSERYSDRTKKRLIFKQIRGEWRIVRELTLKVLG